MPYLLTYPPHAPASSISHPISSPITRHTPHPYKTQHSLQPTGPSSTSTSTSTFPQSTRIPCAAAAAAADGDFEACGMDGLGRGEVVVCILLNFKARTLYNCIAMLFAYLFAVRVLV